MNKKRILSLFALFFAIVMMISSCASSSTRRDDDDDDEEEVSSSEKMAKDNLFTKYDNVKVIKEFTNGLAPFLIHADSSTSHWVGMNAWLGEYYFGYIDTKGRVVIEPTYECSPYDIFPAFESDYIRYSDMDNKDYLINKKGEIIYQTGVNGVTRIGNISEGYFWVETEKEDLSGSVYTVTYYRAKDLAPIVYFEDARAFYENRGTLGESTLTSSGTAMVIEGDDHSYYNSELIQFNMAKYDASYVPSDPGISLDLENISEFSAAPYGYYNLSGKNNDNGCLAAVMLRNNNGTWYYAIADSNGKVLLSPQQTVTFPIQVSFNTVAGLEKYDFCKNLCPAMDSVSGYWGYVDPKGNWAIKPEYSSAEPFTADGYATVNEKIVIDTNGKIRIAPKGWKNEAVTSLSGRYKYDLDGAWMTYYLIFNEDGTVERRESSSAGSSWNTGTYQIKGSIITFQDIGMGIGCPVTSDVEYSFRKEGNKIYIDETVWVLVSE